MTPRCSEAFMAVGCMHQLSTLTIDGTSESSLDSSSERSVDSSSSFAGPSRKRCRSPTTLVPSSTPVLRLIASTHVDLLPPHKRFRDSYSPEDSGEEHVEIGIGVEAATSDIREDDEEFEAESSTGGMMEIVVDPLVTGGISESTRGDAPNLEGTLYDIAHYMSERAGLADRVRILGWENLRIRALLCIGRDQVDSLRHHMALSQEEFRQICRDRDDTRRRLMRSREALDAREANRNIRLGNGNDEGGDGNGDGNGNGGGNGNGNHNENDRDVRPVVRECIYQDFMKCQPLNFKGTKGVVGLIRWFEKMETVFHISNCLEKYQVKYATCALLNSALTWWNSHKRTIGTDSAFAMSWRELMKLMAEVYCLRSKIQKMEYEL
ncbi:hypothetical protein Tco_0460924 [Tanacetum coccineum]